MDITVNRSDLTKVMSAAGKVIEHRQTVPILANALLSAVGGRLAVVGNDLDIEISSSCACEGGDGVTTVDARRLVDIAKRMAGDIVSLSIKDDKLIVKSGRSRFTLPTLQAEDYPRLDSNAFDVEFKCDLAALVAPVKFAMSDETTRYYLCGVYLHATKDGLRAVATDGHRLAHNTAPSVGEIPDVIIPAKTVGLIPAGEIDVSLSSNKIRLATADTIIVSKLVDGTFPDYLRVIPTSNDNILTVDRKDLANAVARASAVASERGKGAKFTIGNDNITVDMRTDDGTAHEDVPATYSGAPLEIGFNSAYVGDVLAAVPGEEITVAMGDAGSPAIFRGEGEVLALLMPMRVAA